jgi:hypothetical protein
MNLYDYKEIAAKLLDIAQDMKAFIEEEHGLLAAHAHWDDVIEESLKVLRIEPTESA